jgi:thiol-disulfide isomerase/thioredoxin
MLFIQVSLPAQMELMLRLSKADSTTITITKVVRVDSMVPVTSMMVYDKKVTIDIPLPPGVLDKNPVLNCDVFNSSGERYNAFFPGLNESLEVDMRTGKLYYDRKGRFYEFARTLYTNAHPSVKQQNATEEMAKLVEQYPQSEYLDFLVYNAVVQGNLEEDAIGQIVGSRDPNAYWLQRIGAYNIEKEGELRNFFDTLGLYAMTHDIVMVKFWGNWCRPCRDDNLALKDMAAHGKPLPVIVGVQYDRSLDEDTFYTNILDRRGIIANHFQVQAFPTYVLVKGQDVVYRTHLLSEALEF